MLCPHLLSNRVKKRYQMQCKVYIKAQQRIERVGKRQGKFLEYVAMNRMEWNRVE